MGRIKWNRSEDGFVESKCGQWNIVPKFCSCTRPQYYGLEECDPKTMRLIRKHGQLHETQREAKDEAELETQRRYEEAHRLAGDK